MGSETKKEVGKEVQDKEGIWVFGDVKVRLRRWARSLPGTGSQEVVYTFAGRDGYRSTGQTGSGDVIRPIVRTVAERAGVDVSEEELHERLRSEWESLPFIFGTEGGDDWPDAWPESGSSGRDGAGDDVGGETPQFPPEPKQPIPEPSGLDEPEPKEPPAQAKAGSREEPPSWKVFLQHNYREEIELLAMSNKRSLTVDYDTLRLYSDPLAEQAVDEPRSIFGLYGHRQGHADVALTELILEYLGSDLGEVVDYHVRLRGLHGDRRVRDAMRRDFMWSLTCFDGLVMSVTTFRQDAIVTIWECLRCNEIIRIDQPDPDELIKPVLCENRSCASRGPFHRMKGHEGEVTVDWQAMNVQEKPESLERETTPRAQTVILRDDLCDVAKPGAKIRVTGMPFTLPVGQSKASKVKRAEEACFEALHVDVVEFLEDIKITEAEKAKIITVSKEPDILGRMSRSLAPGVHGYELEKKAILLQDFGGTTIRGGPEDTAVADRGWSNILLVGDPAIAKSDLLHANVGIVPGSLYGSGTGSSKVGLTAATMRDELTGGWLLQAGVVVLAHGAVVCIDEFDKLSPEDRKGLTQCMEHGTLRIDKINIHATLRAETAVLAAANPKYGRWDPYRGLLDQVEIEPQLLSRFDLIFVLRDRPDRKRDEKIAMHILQRRQGVLPAPEFEVSFIQKYIAYARRNVQPKILSDEIQRRVAEHYAEERQKSNQRGGFAYDPRACVAIARLSEASARARLSEEVTQEDMDMALSLIDYSLKQCSMTEEGYIDTTVLATGKSTGQWDSVKKFQDLVRLLCDRHGGLVPRKELLKEAVEIGLAEKDAVRLLGEMKRKGDVYEPKRGYIAKS